MIEQVAVPADRPPLAIAEKLSSKIDGLFERRARKTGTWQAEQDGVDPGLLQYANPDARRSNYLTRTDLLLLSSNLNSKSPEFKKARDVMSKLIGENRPDVLLWALQGFYPDDPSFRQFAIGSDLKTALKNGIVKLPEDFYQQVDLLCQFDEYEGVGDHNANRLQTPLKPIIKEIVKEVTGKKTEPVLLQVKHKTEAIVVNGQDSLQKLLDRIRTYEVKQKAGEVLTASKDVLSSARDNFRKAFDIFPKWKDVPMSDLALTLGVAAVAAQTIALGLLAHSSPIEAFHTAGLIYAEAGMAIGMTALVPGRNTIIQSVENYHQRKKK